MDMDTNNNRYPTRDRIQATPKSWDNAARKALTESIRPQQRATAQQKRGQIKDMVIQNLQYTPLYNTLIKNKDDFEVMMEEMNKLTVQDSGSEMNTGRGKRRRTLKKRTLKKRTLKRMTKRRRY
jgi:hypothetical protein